METVASLFGLSARLLPLIPKAERRRFIAEHTSTLPTEFKVFRESLEALAEQAPEVRALNPRDVIRLESGDFGWKGSDMTITNERKNKEDDPPVTPAPKM